GTIELAAPDGEGAAILFIEGQPSKVRTSVPVMYLGRVLLELGAIDERVLNDSLMTMSKSRRLHGEILREMGAISDAQLVTALKEQLLRKLHHMVDLAPETTFQYFDAFDALADYGGDEMVSIDPYPLVWSAVREAPP